MLIDIAIAWVVTQLLNRLLGGHHPSAPAYTPASPSGAPVVTHATPVPASYTPPWPTTMSTPAGLPPFPGAGWEPDSPPPPAVVSRASALLPALWRAGEGAHRIEQTDGRWIAYRAMRMGTKKGVAAYRERATAPAPPVPAAHYVPASAPLTHYAPPPPAAHAAPPSHVSLPTLRRGSRGNDVKLVQAKVGASPVDGVFGHGTEAKVRIFQAAHGLTADGIVGRATWAALMGGGGAMS